MRLSAHTAAMSGEVPVTDVVSVASTMPHGHGAESRLRRARSGQQLACPRIKNPAIFPVLLCVLSNVSSDATSFHVGRHNLLNVMGRRYRAPGAALMLEV